jgi:hypothetical protein
MIEDEEGKTEGEEAEGEKWRKMKIKAEEKIIKRRK